MIVISDTSPLNYLVLIGEVEVLPRLFSRVIIPRAVARELGHAKTPEPVRQFLAAPPPWLETREAPAGAPSSGLDPGEQEAIRLALELLADAVLIDDHQARLAARGLGLTVVGTLGILLAAHRQRLLDLRAAVGKLRTTTFHVTEEVIGRILEQADPE